MTSQPVDGKVYCATPYSLYSVNLTDNSIERLSRVTGLSETGISAIKYDEANSKLFIAYENSNIDIIYRNEILLMFPISKGMISLAIKRSIISTRCKRITISLPVLG
ncbi:MAG: hypothetical protein WDO16_20250 [Bacteroidota bacterium]